MNTIFLAFVINYCAYCDRFKEEALPGILASKEEQVVIWNASESKFLHGAVSDIHNYKNLVKGYPTFIIIKNGEVVKTWEGFEEYQFWVEYNER